MSGKLSVQAKTYLLEPNDIWMCKWSVIDYFPLHIFVNLKQEHEFIDQRSVISYNRKLEDNLHSIISDWVTQV